MIGWRDGEGGLHRDSLFGVFAALARGEAWSFTALRPHQREPWHAFTVQVAALALIHAGRDDLPADEATWRDLLIGLTPEHPDGEAWALVVDDWSKPALLQPPVVDAANRADYKSRLPTPDALDMLVTAKNHDVKQERMATAVEEDWLFALVTLQTTEGFLGAGNYGISRMNGGFATRMSLGVRPSGGGTSAPFRRDVRRLVTDAGARPDRRGGTALLWTVPWDGTDSLRITDLDELYVEICRRVRLRQGAAGIEAVAAGSKCARVAAAELKGRTEDPWAPIKADGSTSHTPTGAGFGYRQMANLLDKEKITAPLLARLHEDDDRTGLAFVASALVRGQGKTDGLHRRSVKVSRIDEIDQFQDVEVLDRVGSVAMRRASDAWEASRRLRRALIILMCSGEDRDDLIRARDGDAEAWTEALRYFDHRVDRQFFNDAFWLEAVNGNEKDVLRWREELRDIAEEVLSNAAAQAPRTVIRRDKSRARAENRLAREMGAWLKEIVIDEEV